MDFSMRRVNALVRKEMKDIVRNPNITVVGLIPLIGAIFISIMVTDEVIKMQLLPVLFLMNSALLTPMIMAMIISEEKEKNTLRTLMLSTVTPTEFLTGKGIVTWLYANITNIAIYLIISSPKEYLLIYIITSLFTSTIMIFIGAIIGIISKTVMSTGTNSLPILLIFYIFPYLAQFNITLSHIAVFLPTYHSQMLLNKMVNNHNIDIDYGRNFIALIAWILISFIIFVMIYRRRRFDR
ncbi:membrane protein [Vallitalea longa]|uniref:Membrane protein n=1 Tax=Vallitalea longa TaxID=2936439 RepID=A0A9W5Y8Z8_9FIRM|nr:ABC transporter permease [Vallitalea longa]GKX28266.1 membrane protein [Vallitalea longa]